MFSFQNITANNGWAMAIAGALIVMTGLTVLSFIISQLHRIVGLVEKKEAPVAAPKTDPAAIPEQFPGSLDQVADLYAPLVKGLPEDFGLEELYALTRDKNYPHPHLTIRAFREAGILVAKGDGKFSWNA